MEDIKQYSFPIAVLLIVIAIGYFLFRPTGAPVTPTQSPIATASTTQATQTTTKTMEKPTMQLDAKKHYSAVMHTDKGDISIDFDTTNTPITSNNFITLAKNHFYDGVIFHRIISGFMIQGGDPTGTGTGGPGYQFADEYLKGEYKRGTVAMANAGPNTNGSQFFIMHADYALPNDYVIFGHVTKGMEVVDQIATAPKGASDKPTSPVKITSVEIIEK